MVSVGRSTSTSGGGSEVARKRGNCRNDDVSGLLSLFDSGSESAGVTGTVKGSGVVLS